MTTYAREKKLARTRARFASLEGSWRGLSNLDVAGYEIHLGRTRALPSARVAARSALLGEGAAVLGWQLGAVLGVYCHGLLENPAVLAALTGRAAVPREAAFDRVADIVERSFTPGILDSLIHRR